MGNLTNPKREELVNYIFGKVFEANATNVPYKEKELKASML
jgi:hypothetical protein